MKEKKGYFGDKPENEDGTPVMEEDYSYLSSIYFLFTEEGFVEFASGASKTFQDGVHAVDSCGDSAIFYDNIRYQSGLARNNERGGKVEVAYYYANIPIFFRKMLLKIAKPIWNGLMLAQVAAIRDSINLPNGRVGEASDRAWAREAPKVEMTFSQKYRERITRLYGQGRGQVRIDNGYEPEKVQAQLAIDMKDPEFVRNYEAKIQMARNSTYGHHQTAKLFIRLDSRVREGEKSPGYYWETYSPRGRIIMNGAILDHRRSITEPTSWTSHT
jgi:hypothetical protein